MEYVCIDVGPGHEYIHYARIILGIMSYKKNWQNNGKQKLKFPGGSTGMVIM